MNSILNTNVDHDPWKELYNSLILNDENNVNLQEYHDTGEILI